MTEHKHCLCKERGEEPIIEVMAEEELGPGPNGERQVARQLICHRCQIGWSEVVDKQAQTPA